MHGRNVRLKMSSLALVLAAAVGDQSLGGAPPPKGIALSPLGVYRTGFYDEGAVEIAAFDPATARAFVTFAERPQVDAIDLSDPAAPALAFRIDLTPWGADAHATSVAVRDGLLAVAVPQGVEDTAAGKVLFFDVAGVPLSEVTVGALPDMLTFTPNGRFVLTANEGQPLDDYTVDPEGSVSIIDVTGGAASLTERDVTTADFRAFDNVPLDPSIRIFGPGATVAQDLEPEYITVSHDSGTAWVTLQENNAIAAIDLNEKRVTRLMGLGFKDHSVDGAGLDGGRDDGAIRILPWPVRGMYLPDGMASFRHQGQTYLVTANEGDVREYGGLNAAGTEVAEIEDLVLDPVAFPPALAATLQSRPNGIGRLKVSAFDGDTDGDGDYDQLYSYGGRSFSIWSADGRLVFDSGDLLEQVTASALPAWFNASNTNNTRDDRSDDKGPEPEGVTVAHLFGRPYVFVMLERIGGVAVFDVTSPAAPAFVQYINTRDFSSATGTGAAGDLGPEAARVVPAELSPTGAPLLLVSNEVSGSLRVFTISARQ
jgi:2',3'-cyclic-nucleotide 2'-phosphodiesterase/3'-nucleotidase/5'-nucleotidase